MKKNIALFQTAMDVGGIQKSLINLLNRIDYEKYNIDLYILGGGSFFKQIPSKVNVIVLDNKKWYKYVPFKAVYHLTKVDKSIKYDVSIDFNGYNNYLSSHALKIDAKRKVLFVHNDFKKKYLNERKFRILYNLSKKKYGMYDDIVSVSLGVKNSFYELTGIKAKYVIPNYIDTKKIIDSSMDNVDFHVDDDNINFCFLGRLVYQKGWDLLFPIIKEYKENNEDYALLNVYEDSYSVCGTGRTEDTFTLNNNQEATIGYYYNNTIWSDISLKDYASKVAIINYSLNENDAKEILEFIKTLEIKEN